MKSTTPTDPSSTLQLMCCWQHCVCIMSCYIPFIVFNNTEKLLNEADVWSHIHCIAIIALAQNFNRAPLHFDRLIPSDTEPAKNVITSHLHLKQWWWGTLFVECSKGWVSVIKLTKSRNSYSKVSCKLSPTCTLPQSKESLKSAEVRMFSVLRTGTLCNRRNKKLHKIWEEVERPQGLGKTTCFLHLRAPEPGCFCAGGTPGTTYFVCLDNTQYTFND